MFCEILWIYCGKVFYVIVIDYYIGFGEFVVGELFGFDKLGEFSYEDVKVCWGDNYIFVYFKGIMVYEIYGIFFKVYLEELLNVWMYFLLYEFGMIDESKVLKYMREDYWFYIYG